jgi:hypothetical protein
VGSRRVGRRRTRRRVVPVQVRPLARSECSVGRWLLLAVGGLSAAGFYKWQDRQADVGGQPSKRDALPKASRATSRLTIRVSSPTDRGSAPAVILVVFAVLGFQSGYTTRDRYIRPYCLYGARSDAQLAGCMSHVTSDDIDAVDTQAARFARGETSDCLADSGPFAAPAAKWNAIDEPAP